MDKPCGVDVWVFEGGVPVADHIGVAVAIRELSEEPFGQSEGDDLDLHLAIVDGGK